MNKIRPRLADHALLRHHVIDGAPRFVLHHALTGALVVLDERAAAVARVCDGTRDFDGVCLAVARDGAYRRASEIAAVLESLDQNELLADGLEHGALEGPDTVFGGPSSKLAGVPVAARAGFGFRCGGAGHCCSQYGSYVLTEREHGLAQALLPDVAAATPLSGVRRGKLALPLVDGACVALTSQRRCGLEEVGGLTAKPRGCRTYPARFVFDGERVVAGVWVECECVITSVAEGATEPLVGGERVADLAPGTPIRVLPERIALGDGVAVAVSEYRARVAEIAAEGGAKRALELGAALDPALGQAGQIQRLEQLTARLARASENADAWRGAKDRTRRTRRATLGAARAVLARGLASSAEIDPFPALEAFVLDNALFSHQLVEGGTLAEGLCELGLSLLVARELSLSGPPDLGHPIVVVLSALRGAGAA